MHTRLGLCVAALLVMTACRTELAVTARPGASKATSSPAATGASVKPIPVASAAAANLRLQAPADGGTPLAGKLMIDASYLVASGAGNVLTRPEGQVALVSQGLLSQDGGGLISQDGGGLVAQGAGNLVAQGAGNLVAQGAGNLVASEASGKVVASQGSVALVAQGAGNLISQDGGGLVAQGAGNYRLQAAATPPAAGTQLPAAGMLVSVVDLVTNQYLPLGRDAKGHPVFTVYSDTAGGYQVYLPKGHSTQVMVVASSPATRDSRLTYNLITAPMPRVATLDETSALLTLFLRMVFGRHLETYVRAAKSDQPPCQPNRDPALVSFAALTDGFTLQLESEVAAVKLYDQPPTVQHQLAGLMIDHAVAALGDLEQYDTTASLDGLYVPPPDREEKAFQFMRTQLEQLNLKVATIMRDPVAKARLEGQLKRWHALATAEALGTNQFPFMRDDHTCNTPMVPPPPLEALRKPSDVGTFMVDALLADGYPSRDGYALELFEVTGLAAGPASVLDPGAADDEVVNSALHAKHASSVTDRPAFAFFRHLIAANESLLVQLAGGIRNHELQCKMLREINPQASCKGP